MARRGPGDHIKIHRRVQKERRGHKRAERKDALFAHVASDQYKEEREGTREEREELKLLNEGGGSRGGWDERARGE
eukprot:scaffold39311_cov32-Tisochrysis_lutea.AAC.9